MQPKVLWALALSVCSLVVASLACQANASNMAVNGTPLYICPSSTPAPTSTSVPPDPPTYYSSFQANLNYNYVDPTRSVVSVQFIAQNVGPVQVSYSGTNQDGSVWLGSNGYFPIAFTGPNSPGVISAYGVLIPSNVRSATILVTSNWGGPA